MRLCWTSQAGLIPWRTPSRHKRAGPHRGDFNASALGWSMPHFNVGRKLILKMAARTRFVVINTGSTSWFRRLGCEGNLPGVTFSSESIVSLIGGWRVLEEFATSDHQHIAFVVDETSRCRRPRRFFLCGERCEVEHREICSNCWNRQSYPRGHSTHSRS